MAIVTCAGDTVDPDGEILVAALASVGLSSEQVPWDDPGANWDDYDLCVVRSTWDYAERRDEFLAWATRVPRLANSAPVLAYSTDKHYLAELARSGVRVIPTTFVDVGDDWTAPEGDFVVKPAVGAGSMDAERYGPGTVGDARAHVARLHARGRDVLVQPYLDTIDVEGELALVFLDGEFSHALRKGAMLNVTELDRTGLYRVEQMSIANAPADAVSFASSVLAASPFTDLLYARVDAVRTDEGWALMELELAEPWLFFSFVPAAAARLALAVRARVTTP